MFPLDRIFPTPSMITSPEDMTLYNINESLGQLIDAEQIKIEGINILINKLDEIVTQLDKVEKAAKSAAKSPSSAKKGGNA